RPSGMGLKALSYFELRKYRSFFSKRRCNSLLPGIGWFHHVRVRRNQPLAACIISIASHKIFPPLTVRFVLAKDRFQTRPLLSIGRSTITDLNRSRFGRSGVLEYRSIAS